MNDQPPEIHQERFEAWLLSQPDDRTFDYKDNNDCLVCKFLKETTDLKTPCVAATYYRKTNHGTRVRIPDFVILSLSDGRIDELMSNSTNGDFYTFGGMKRAWLKLYPESQPVIEPAVIVHNHPQPEQKK